MLCLPYPKSPSFSRPVPLLKSLHWLPAYQALSSTQPAYLNSLPTPATSSSQLRLITSNHLYIPWVKTKAGTRAFPVAATTL